MDEGDELVALAGTAAQSFLVLFIGTLLGAVARQKCSLPAVIRVTTSTSPHIEQYVFSESIGSYNRGLHLVGTWRFRSASVFGEVTSGMTC